MDFMCHDGKLTSDMKLSSKYIKDLVVHRNFRVILKATNKYVLFLSDNFRKRRLDDLLGHYGKPTPNMNLVFNSFYRH